MSFTLKQQREAAQVLGIPANELGAALAAHYDGKLSTAQAAAYLGIGVRNLKAKVNESLAAGKLVEGCPKFSRLSAYKFIFTKADLDQFIQSKTLN